MKIEDQSDWAILADCIRGIPITLVLFVLIVLAYYLVFGEHCYYVCPLDWKNDPTVRLFLHPLIHASQQHLWGNMFAFVILGSLVETWMAPLSRKRHVVIFGLSYLVSFLFVLVAWIAFGSEPGIGASGMVFAILGFVVYYYYAFPNLLQLQGRRRHAPLLIGIVLAPLIISLFTFVPASHIGFQLQVAVTLYTFAIHWICFIFAFFAARVVYQKWRLPRPLPLSP